MLINLVVEMLAIAVHANKYILGVSILPSEYKLALYADKVVFFIQDPVKSMKALNALLGTFAEIPSYMINDTGKSVMMYVGTDDNKRVQIG